MMLHTRGIARNIENSTVGKVTRRSDISDPNAFLVSEIEPEKDFKGVLSSGEIASAYFKPSVGNVFALDHLEEGDVIVAYADGTIHTLYRVSSKNNTLLATERCNSNCLMCSQPPKDKDDIPRIFDILMQAIPLIPKDCRELGISGGEPTLMGERFFNILEQIKSCLPETEVHILTNGRSFAWQNVTERLASLNFERLMLGVPLYADTYHIHDHVVQARGAFYQTVSGLHNLARYGQRLELRVVLHKLTIPRLEALSRFVYKNLPFVEHVAFMGMEDIGYATPNSSKLTLDPYEYMTELTSSVQYLSERGIHVSVYNLQHCLLPEVLWPFSRKSISDWKNSYLPVCTQCSKLGDCGGFFKWNTAKPSPHIKAFA